MLAVCCVSIDVMFVLVCHSCLQEGGARELQASQPHLDPWEGHLMEQVILEIICRHLKYKKLRSRQHGLTKG